MDFIACFTRVNKLPAVLGKSPDATEFIQLFLENVINGLGTLVKIPRQEKKSPEAQSSDATGNYSLEKTTGQTASRQVSCLLRSKIEKENSFKKYAFSGSTRSLRIKLDCQSGQVLDENLDSIESDLSFIFLPVEEGNLYSAWEKEFFGLEETAKFYKSLGGDKSAEIQCKIKTQDWITNPPQQLRFLLKRTKNNFSDQKQTNFSFDSTIFIDRFMLENRQKINHAAEITKCKKNIEEIQKKYQQLAESDVLGQLGSSAQFLEAQIQQRVQNTDLACPKTTRQSEKSTINSAITLLQAYQQELNEKFKGMEKDIENQRSQLEAAYKGFNKHKYSLSTVYIHLGSEDQSGGRYICLVHDFKSKAWREFNDKSVQQIGSETDFKAYMQKHLSNVCCLIYLNDESVQKLEKMEQNLLDHYRKLIPEETKQQTIKEEAFSAQATVLDKQQVPVKPENDKNYNISDQQHVSKQDSHAQESLSDQNMLSHELSQEQSINSIYSGILSNFLASLEKQISLKVAQINEQMKDFESWKKALLKDHKLTLKEIPPLIQNFSCFVLSSCISSCADPQQSAYLVLCSLIADVAAEQVDQELTLEQLGTELLLVKYSTPLRFALPEICRQEKGELSQNVVKQTLEQIAHLLQSKKDNLQNLKDEFNTSIERQITMYQSFVMLKNEQYLLIAHSLSGWFMHTKLPQYLGYRPEFIVVLMALAKTQGLVSKLNHAFDERTAQKICDNLQCVSITLAHLKKQHSQIQNGKIFNLNVQNWLEHIQSQVIEEKLMQRVSQQFKDISQVMQPEASELSEAADTNVALKMGSANQLRQIEGVEFFGCLIQLYKQVHHMTQPYIQLYEEMVNNPEKALTPEQREFHLAQQKMLD